MTLLQILEAGVPVVAFLMMLAVGLDVTQSCVREITGRWRFVLAATAAQAVLLPAAAVLLVRIAAPDPRPGEYLLLLAACPGGTLSNVYVYLARANTTLSVILTAISSLLTIATFPLATAAYATIQGQAPGFALPIPTLLAQLLVMSVFPVVLGAWLRHRWPDVQARYGKNLHRFCTAGLVAIVAIGLVQSMPSLNAAMLTGALLSAPLVLASMAIGWLFGMLCRVPRADRFTLLIEFAVRNLAIAMVMEVTLLHHPDFVAFGSVSLVVQLALIMLALRSYKACAARERAQ